MPHSDASQTFLHDSSAWTLLVQDFNGASMAPVVLVSVPRTRMGKHWAVDPKRFVITTSGQVCR